MRDAECGRFRTKLRVRNAAILGGLQLREVILACEVELVDDCKQFFAEFDGLHRFHDHTILAAPSKSIVVAMCQHSLSDCRRIRSTLG
jgi:hypothetical protein